MDLKVSKRTGTLIGALLLLAGYSVYTNLLSGPDVPASSARANVGTPTPPPSLPEPAPLPKSARAPAAARGLSGEWKPAVLPKRPEDRPDVAKIDPTLQWWRFQKVQEVPPAGGSRNLFQFGTAPPPKPVELAGKTEPRVFIPYGPKSPQPPPPQPPPPPPPPITLKFYGWSTTTAAGKRMGYFLDGEEILLAGEGDTLKRRYKIVRIGPNAALIEDIDAKHQQSVPLTEEGQGE